MQKLVIYNHGKDSIPWGEKALALAEVAKRHGFMFISPDYQACNDPDLRVKQLLAMDLSIYQEIVLVGSSMGAYVATVASEIIRPKGLFLIAPAFYLPGYQCTEFKPHADRIEVFHGWQDEVVPPENVWRFCQQHRACLHILNADHRLLSILPIMADAFDRFLRDCVY
jgi:pimeloyl-ACP methyl ester carboxylesterase